MEVSYKTKHTITMQSNHTPWYLPKEDENMFTQIPIHRCNSSFITIAKTWKQPRYPSVGEWINYGLNYPNTGILISAKNKQALKPWKDREEV